MQYLFFFSALGSDSSGFACWNMLCNEIYWSSHTLRSCHVKSMSLSGFKTYFKVASCWDDRGTTLQNAHCFLFLRRLLSQLTWFYLPNLWPFPGKAVISPACWKLTYMLLIMDRKDTFENKIPQEKNPPTLPHRGLYTQKPSCINQDDNIPSVSLWKYKTIGQDVKKPPD